MGHTYNEGMSFNLGLLLGKLFQNYVSVFFICSKWQCG